MGSLDILLNSISLLTLPPFCFKPCLDSRLNDTKFDFIVVGGGSAGSVLASRLSENPKVNVLLLEAGGCPPNISVIPAASGMMFGTDADWNFQTTPQNNAFFSDPNHRGIVHAGRMLGGGSSLNGMIYIRGNEFNFDSWEKLGNPGWAFKDVLPLFLKSEDNTIPSQEKDTKYHNTKGPLIISEGKHKYAITKIFLDAGQERGYPIRDPNGANQTCVSNIPYTMNNEARCSTYYAYLLPAQNRPNLLIVPNAQVTKVIINTTGELKAVGVQYTFNNKTYTTNATKEIILSAGALNTPKILMLSGIGPKQQLQEHKIPVVLDLPGVGENLQDHIACQILQWKLNYTNCPFHVENAISPSNIRNWIVNREGPTPMLFGVGFIPTKFAEEKANIPDIQIALSVFSTDFSKSNPAYYEHWANISTISIIQAVMAPKSRGNVTLQSTDPNQPLIINPNYLSHEDDRKVLVEGLKESMAIVNTTAFKVCEPELNPVKFPECENYTQFSDDYWTCTCRYSTFSANHPVGTSKMGPSNDSMAVVNAQLQVHGINGLRVIDASIMPTIIVGNPNAAAIMIGEKGAEMIKKAHGI